MRFDKHVFICINQRINSERNSCGEEQGLELVTLFKRAVRSRGLNIRAQKTGCLDACDFGPSVVVYPDGIFYGNVQPSDVEEIVESHLVNNKPVERLIIKFPKTDT
ncbi:MAG: (2Fe-2S) ferredoxin domain-containing protein [Bacteroidetes bacterium]|nr:(2Fe-2S) ferredoxin domain-containing protein [Bacteroidota bacterium]